MPPAGDGAAGLAAIVDIDGTLVDTNYHHSIAWQRAFARHGVPVPAYRIHRHIGMGGDQLVGAVAGEEVERELGDEVREDESEIYMGMIEEVQPFDGAREFLELLAGKEVATVLASSAKEREVEHYVELLGAAEVVTGWTTSADVEATKPEPDLIEAARAKVDAANRFMVGDTVWDVKAAAKVGVPTIAVLTGGVPAESLRRAGAANVFGSVADLGQELGETLIAVARAHFRSPG